jgi:hypothetical protein
MGLLDTDIAALFGAAFGGLYLDGWLHRDGTDPIYDDGGNIVGYVGGIEIAIKVQRDKATYAMRQSEGFSEGDVALIILAQGLPALTTDMQVTDGHGARWMIQSADLDAASSHWICRGRAA